MLRYFSGKLSQRDSAMKFENVLLVCVMPALLAFGGWGNLSAAEPASADLRPKFEKWELGERRQGGRGTCSVFAVTGALEFALAAKDGRGTRLSPEFLNWASNKKCGNRQDGGFFSDLWSGFEAFGICREASQPYAGRFEPDLAPAAATLDEAAARRNLGLKMRWIKRWDVRTGIDEVQLASIKSTLLSGWPVCGGFRWPKHEEWKDGVLRMRGPDEVFDGHSVLLVGFRDDPAQPGGGVLIFRNSGGSGKDGAMPYGYARLFLNDAMWIGPVQE